MEKVAVIGSGLAGLTAAHLLSKQLNVTIFEFADKTGMDVASVSVKDINNDEVRIDVPMRSINEAYYPSLFKLFKYVGMETTVGKYEVAEYHWDGPASQQNQNKSYFSFHRHFFFGFEFPWALVTFAGTSMLLTLQFLFEFLRILLHTFYLTQTKSFNSIKGTFGDFVKEHHFSDEFVKLVLLPALATMATSTHQALLDYPARIILHVIAPFGSTFAQAKGGMRLLCQKLLSNVKEVHYNQEIIGAWTLKNDQVVIQTKDLKLHTFDKIVFAVQGSIAKKILARKPPTELQDSVKPPLSPLMDCLNTFKYESVPVVVHTEKSLMPFDKTQWRGINCTTDGKESMATIWVNYTHRLPEGSPDFFETSCLFVNPKPVIPKEKILNQYTFPRSYVTEQSCEALNIIEHYQGRQNIYFVGSWVWPGMPLLEGCVASAIRVAERIGIPRGWEPEGRECLPWTAESEDKRGLVERYLSNDLTASQPKRGTVIQLLANIGLVYLKFQLDILTGIIGFYRSIFVQQIKKVQ
ncbi:hypothetical protein HDV02_005151 [Globomyces sp. JEL0801]|nr:hypothetical protein HDV02_005151 [Globomyces sp. JEL0801]